MCEIQLGKRYFLFVENQYCIFFSTSRIFTRFQAEMIFLLLSIFLKVYTKAFYSNSTHGRFPRSTLLHLNSSKIVPNTLSFAEAANLGVCFSKNPAYGGYKMQKVSWAVSVCLSVPLTRGAFV